MSYRFISILVVKKNHGLNNKKMDRTKYKCPKCGNKYFETGEMRATGSFVKKLFNIQNRKFSSITCTQCKYTEFFATPSNQLGNILDFFTN